MNKIIWTTENNGNIVSNLQSVYATQINSKGEVISDLQARYEIRVSGKNKDGYKVFECHLAKYLPISPKFKTTEKAQAWTEKYDSEKFTK